MTLKFLLAAVLATSLSGLFALPSAQADTGSSAVAPSARARVIVRFKANAASVRAQPLSLNAARAEASSIAQARATALGQRTGQTLRALGSIDALTHVMVASGVDSATLVKRLTQDSQVDFVVIDQRRRAAQVTTAPNDPMYSAGDTATDGLPAAGQWYLHAPTPNASTAPVASSINAPAAWALTTGSASIVIADIDTGARFDHPDLTSRFIPVSGQTLTSGGYGYGYDFVSYSSCEGTTSSNSDCEEALWTNNVGCTNIDVSAAGCTGASANASDPGDWITAAENVAKTGSVEGPFYGCGAEDGNGNPVASLEASSWHGTRTAGLIGAASNNDLGITGVTWQNPLLVVRVLGKCGGYDSDIIAGMEWAAGIAVPGVPTNSSPARVVNMSLGGTGTCTCTTSACTKANSSDVGQVYLPVIQQLTTAGTVIVAAAGNSEGEAVGVPGNCAGVIAVGGLRQAGDKVGFASLGPEVSISAPAGNCVNTAANSACLYPMLSTYNNGTTTPGTNSYTDGLESVGTSFSTPLVTGTVGLMLSVNPSLTPSQVLSILKSTARSFPAPTVSGGVTTDAPGVTTGTAQCTAPTSSTQDECYCTTSTCGAGMLDAGAAVKAAAAMLAAPTLQITSSTATAGTAVTLTGAVTGLSSGQTVATYAWTITSAGGIVTAFSSATNAATATLTPSAAGSFTVQLSVTDNYGDVYTDSSTVTVAAASGTTTTTSGSSSSGSTSSSGGGGAVQPLWLLGLLLAGALLPRRRAAAKTAAAQR